MNGQIMTLPAGDDDTIELVLTPEQMLELSHAAEEQAAPAIPVPAPLAPTFPAPQTVVEDIPASPVVHWHHTPLAKMAANTLVFVAFAWWSVSQLAGQPQPHPERPVTAAAPRPIAITPVAAVEPPPPAVHVVNPFDRTEVFDFPPGTSADESREKVAQILLQRARERHSHWERTKPEASLRTASLATARKSGPGT